LWRYYYIYMEKNRQSLGILLVITAGVTWGTISIFIHVLNGAGLDSMDITCYRAWFAALMLLVYFLIKDKALLRINPRDIWMFVGTGVFSLTFFSICYFTTITNVGTAVAVVLLYTSPVFVTIFGVLFFKEKITSTKLIAVVMTFAGCVLVAGLAGGTDKITGMNLLTGLGAGFGYALYSLFAGFALKKYSSLTITFYTFVFCGLSMLIIHNPVELIAKIDASVLPYLLGIALVCSVIPYITYTAGMSRMEVGKAAVLVTVEPLVGSLIGILVWGEPVTPLKIIGIGLILGSVVIMNL